MAKMKKYPDLEAYFEDLPEDVRMIMQKLRRAIRKAAPDAEEKLSYRMPSFVQGGQLMYYAAWKQHIGFYPASSDVFKKFKGELSGYKVAKGTIQFRLDEPLPLDLVTRMIRFRVEENRQRLKEKQALKEKGRAMKRTPKVCRNGHEYFKSSDCPVCPVCESDRKPEGGLLGKIAAPARRALERVGATSAAKLSRFSEAEILALHGMGPASLPALRAALKTEGRSFRKK